jgi:hypothetical protein
LNLNVHLSRRRDVLRVHHGHHELAEHLNLLDLLEGNLVADLNRLQIADRRLILELKGLQRCLLRLEVLGLSLSRSEAPFRVFNVVSMLACGL